MIVKETILQGCFILEPNVYKDHRGSFFESYNKRDFESHIGTTVEFVQDNQSTSDRGVLRGLHFQAGNAAQAKLVRVISGSVIDVVVDIRPESPTFGQHIKTHLSVENKQLIFIPKGMAHGFLSLENDTIFTYKCDNYYQKEMERGILYSDPNLNIDWEYPVRDLILSEKDRNLPSLKKLDL